MRLVYFDCRRQRLYALLTTLAPCGIGWQRVPAAAGDSLAPCGARSGFEKRVRTAARTTFTYNRTWWR
eukprot:3474593-Pyramimonas_sp.AAC.1